MSSSTNLIRGRERELASLADTHGPGFRLARCAGERETVAQTMLARFLARFQRFVVIVATTCLSN